MSETDDSLTPFARLRLAGGRYEEEGYPLVGLPELARYERLIFEVARALWRRDNPDRRRMPRNFGEQLDLRLSRVEAGSVTPVLGRGTGVDGQYPLAGLGDYFEHAREAVDEAFAELVESGVLPATFPVEAVGSLAQFGKSLRDDEAVYFRTGTDRSFAYNQRIRKRLLTTGQVNEVTRDGVLLGRLTALDADARTFTLTMLSAAAVPGRYEDRELTSVFRELLNESRLATVVRLEARFTEVGGDLVTRIDDVWDVEEFAVADLPSADRLMDLAYLEEGWLNGGGGAISFAALDFARDVLTGVGAAGLQAPKVFPMEDGGVQLEWIDAARGLTVSVDISADVDVEFSARGPRIDVEDTLKAPRDVLHLLAGVLGE